MVGISTDHMKATEVGWVRMSLVASIDNRAVKGSLQANFIFDKVSSLRDLKTGKFTALADSNASCTTNNRAGYEERGEASDKVIKINTTTDLVVLVGAVSRTLTIRVVLHQHDLVSALTSR